MLLYYIKMYDVTKCNISTKTAKFWIPIGRYEISLAFMKQQESESVEAWMPCYIEYR